MMQQVLSLLAAYLRQGFRIVGTAQRHAKIRFEFSDIYD
jgi:hypothetical protein